MMAIPRVDMSTLNQRWETDFFPRVDRKEFNSTESPYRFGEMVGKIEELVGEGKRACLFIGRTASEPLPEASENEIWVSADLFRQHPEKKEESGRIHLWIDCNQQEAIETLKGLFDRVVIDTSTTRFLGDDFARRFSVLLRSSDSPFIFESNGTARRLQYVAAPSFCSTTYTVTCSLSKLNEEVKKRHEFMETYHKTVSQEQQERDWQEFMQTSKTIWLVNAGLSSREKLKNNFMQYITEKNGISSYSDYCTEWGEMQLQSHLEKIYRHVEFHAREPFPYPENYGRKGYFIVSSPF